jgi:hypothetical protein
VVLALAGPQLDDGLLGGGVRPGGGVVEDALGVLVRLGRQAAAVLLGLGHVGVGLLLRPRQDVDRLDRGRGRVGSPAVDVLGARLALLALPLHQSVLVVGDLRPQRRLGRVAGGDLVGDPL